MYEWSKTKHKIVHKYESAQKWNVRFHMLYTVVWNDYLLIFSQKCHILFHKKVGNSLQIIKYIKLSRFQHILKLKVNFVESLFI